VHLKTADAPSVDRIKLHPNYRHPPLDQACSRSRLPAPAQCTQACQRSSGSASSDCSCPATWPDQNHSPTVRLVHPAKHFPVLNPGAKSPAHAHTEPPAPPSPSTLPLGAVHPEEPAPHPKDCRHRQISC